MGDIRQENVFDSINEMYSHYNGDVVKIVNLRQIIFYGNICGVQPDWIGESPYDRKLIAYYGRERTKECWERWKRTTPGGWDERQSREGV